jgi:putative transposase
MCYQTGHNDRAMEDEVGHWETFYHLVWATKGPEPMIDPLGEAIVIRSFRRTCQEMGVIVRAIGIMPDHVHLVVSIPPRWAVSAVVRNLKVEATHAIRNAVNLPYAGSFSWQNEFGTFTFGEASLETIVRYVANQRKHHASNSARRRYERISNLEPAT